MSLLNIFKTDVEIIERAIDRIDAEEFLGALKKISDAELSKVLSSRAPGCFFSVLDGLFLLPLDESVRDETCARIVKCLMEDFRFEAWFSVCVKRLCQKCYDEHTDGCNGSCRDCLSRNFEWKLIEKVDNEFLASHREFLNMAIGVLWSCYAYSCKHDLGMKSALMVHLGVALGDAVWGGDASVCVNAFQDNGLSKQMSVENVLKVREVMHVWYGKECGCRQYFRDVIRCFELDINDQVGLLRRALSDKDIVLFQDIVDCYNAEVTIQTKEGFNIAMAAAALGDLDVLKWALSKPHGESLLHHKTYLGKTFWDFAIKNRNGEIMNFIRDRSFNSRVNNSPEANKKLHHTSNGFRKKKYKNFDADLLNPTSRLYALLKSSGYIGRAQDFRLNAKNPNNPLHKLVKSLGY